MCANCCGSETHPEVREYGDASLWRDEMGEGGARGQVNL